MQLIYRTHQLRQKFPFSISRSFCGYNEVSSIDLVYVSSLKVFDNGVLHKLRLVHHPTRDTNITKKTEVIAS